MKCERRLFERCWVQRAGTLGASLLIGLSLGGLSLTGCEVEQTEEARAPDVDVSADAGNLPEYEVRKTREGQAPDVDVDVRGGQMPEYDVDTPDVDVDVERERVEVPVPDVDIDAADDDA